MSRLWKMIPCTALFVGVFLWSATTRAVTLTFDDLAPTIYGALPTNYAGFQWTELGDTGVIDPTTYGSLPNGYYNGVVSQTNVAYTNSPLTITNSTPFTFEAGYFTSAWNDNLNLSIQGFQGSALVDSASLVLQVSGPTYFVADFENIDKLVISPSGGTKDPAVSGSGTYVAMDNLSFGPAETTAAPLPSAGFAIFGLLAGLAVIKLVGRSRTSAAV